MNNFKVKPNKEKKQTLQKVPLSTNIEPQLMEEFERLAEDNGLNKAQLLRQMVYHCMGWESNNG